MKQGFVLGLCALLACSAAAMAGVRGDIDQEKTDRQRRVQVSTSGFLGVELGEINSEVAQRLKLREERGALIEGVTSGSSAASAGLQKNDVVVKWDGAPIESARELSRHICETPAGRTVRLGVIRDGREMEINVKMGERTALASSVRVSRATPVARVRVRPEAARERVLQRGHLGVELQSMTEQLAEYFGLSKRTGALVVFVFADSPAAKAGLKAGDVILSMAGENIENPMDLRRILSAKSEGSFEIKILRDKREQTLTVKVEKGTHSWLTDSDETGDVLADLIPMDINIPAISVAPVAVSVPRISIAPMTIAVPKVKIAPVAIPSVDIDIAPMKFDIPMLDIAPVKIDLPKLSIPTIKFRVVPSRVIL